MKNVAVLFSGHIRSYDVLEEVIDSCEKNLVSCNPEYKFKFFMHTWNYLDWYFDDYEGRRGNYARQKTEDEKILEIVSLEKLSITENTNPIMLNSEDRIYGQFKSVHESNNLKKQYENENQNFCFDVSIRTRCDLKICDPLDLSLVDTSRFNITNDEFGFADWFCASSPKLIDYYCGLVLNLESLSEEILKLGCYGHHDINQHTLLMLHLKKIKHGLTFEDFVDLKLNINYHETYKQELQGIENYINRIDFLYYLVRPYRELNQTFKKGYK